MDRNSLTTDLLAAARGETPCDLVFSGGRVVHVFPGYGAQPLLAVLRGVVGGRGGRQARERVDARGRYLVPAFIDGHLHVESTLMSPSALAQAICPR